MQPPRWTTVQESEFPWEREALAYLRERLPDAEPFRAWSNFEFVAADGSINEVDLLVVSLYRVFLVEIKSAPGHVEGDAGTWRWREGSQARTMDNPLLLANRKAKKLKDLLKRQPAMKGQRVPYVEPLIFLSHQNVQVELQGAARQGVYLREGAGDRTGPDVVRVLTAQLSPHDLYASADSRIDARAGRAIEKAMDQAGIRASLRHRQVGDYRLGALLAETDVFQDWEAAHVRFEASRRRVRIYPHALQSSETSRTERRRAAEREFALLDGVVHPGILRVEAFTEHERGPALVFEQPENAERLDFFLQRRGAALDLRQRLELVRQIAETLQYAHARKLFHQSLTPQGVLVAETDAGPVTKVFSWQAGTSEPGTVTGTRPTANHIVRVGLAGEAQGAVYLAPELYSGGRTNPARLDAFSLGALAYHLVSGAAPAATVEELHEKLARDHGLRLSEVVDGVDAELEVLVQLATEPDTRNRLELDDFLRTLNEVIASLADEPGSWADPLEAGPGDELQGGFRVLKRLGKGSTAVALLVERDGREGVLKVALDRDLNDRLRHEGQVLREVQHQNVVTLYEVADVSGHAALFMSVAGTRSGDDGAGSYTLAQRIREEGRLSLDLLQRFGDELLGVVNWLEHNGISHRDVKPDNIGIGQTRQGTLTLFLFDFSLSGVPAENVRAGTPPYLDPFLAQRKPPRWDAYAERFAAAVTLYEMATGQMPTWGDGQSNPALLACEVTLDEELFDASVRERLGRFFRKSLARDYRGRFDNAEEMRRAWVRVFEPIDRPASRSDDGSPDLLAALAEVDEASPVAALPLTPRVLNALERMGVHTLAELQELPRIRLYRNKGIGQPVVREIRDLAEKVAEHFARRAARTADPGSGENDAAVVPQFWSVDLMVRRLAPAAAESDDAAILRALLGLDALAGVGEGWPATQDVAEALGFARHEVQGVVDRARERWGKDRKGWLAPLRDSVASLLEKHGGVMTRAELVGALLAQRGSSALAGERERSAGAVAYAAVEAEAAREGARFVLYRGRDHLFVVGTPELAEPFAATPAARARYAELLGARADELAAADPLLPRERAEEELLAVSAPEGDRPLPLERLLRLAVAASRQAALSSRMEVYPRGMSAVRALRLGAGSLLGPKALPTELVQQRIASRYPEAVRLPDRPALDALLVEAALPYQWDDERTSFAPSDVRPGYLETSSTVGRRSVHGGGDEPGTEEAWALERRLAAVTADRRFLVLTVDPRRHPKAERELLRRHGLTPVNLEARLLREMRAAVDALGARWDVVVRADAAARDSRDWRNLQHVAARAAAAVAASLLELRKPALLVYPGLLARYGQLGVLEQLRVRAEAGEGPGFVLLVAADARSTMPVVDREPLPVVYASEWARVPEPWLRGAAVAPSSPAAAAV